MMHIVKRSVVVILILLNCMMANSAPKPVNLKVEYSDTALGIDVETPRFSWQMYAPLGRRGYRQSAYQIIVRDRGGEIMWDSKKVEDNVSVGIRYAGRPLAATRRYTWSTTIWDQDGESASASSWFETGLMNTDLSAWDGAQWIGGHAEDIVLYSHYLSVFKIEYTIQLDKSSGSTRAGFVLGANDDRLLDKNMNIYGIESERNGHYVQFEIDISGVDGSESGLAKLNIEVDKKRNLMIGLIRPSEILAGPGMFSDNMYTFSVTALIDSIICLIDVDTFKIIFRSNEKFADNFLNSFSHRKYPEIKTLIEQCKNK